MHGFRRLEVASGRHRGDEGRPLHELGHAVAPEAVGHAHVSGRRLIALNDLADGLDDHRVEESLYAAGSGEHIDQFVFVGQSENMARDGGGRDGTGELIEPRECRCQFVHTFDFTECHRHCEQVIPR